VHPCERDPDSNLWSAVVDVLKHHNESEASTETVSRSSAFVLCQTQRRQCVELHAVSRPSHHNHMYFHEHERQENQYMKFRVPCGQRPDDRRNKIMCAQCSNTDDRMQRRGMPTAGARSTEARLGEPTIGPKITPQMVINT
jgi:hypothetical protein